MDFLSESHRLVYSLYKDEKGDPILLTPGQLEMFDAVAMKAAPRLHIMCHTRYGKSMDVALAVLTRLGSFPEKWAITAGTKQKASIIMSYVIQHLFDNDWIKSKFVPDKNESFEEIKRYRNKSRLTFNLGNGRMSELFIGSPKDALGFGAPNLIEDESALINDSDHSLLLRMLGDDPHNNFLVKIGNPFTRGHFLKSSQDPAYKKIVVDCYRSLQEGRITQEMIEENRPYPFFSILYECKFPLATEMDESGWMYLLTDDDIIKAQARDQIAFGIPKLGVDVARGGRNFNAWVLRRDNFAEVIEKNKMDRLDHVGDRTLEHMRDLGILESEVYLDDNGVGGGVTDYLKSKGVKINPVNFGETSDEPDVMNIRAECYAGRDGVSNWVKQGGRLAPHKDWIELTTLRYRKNSRGQTILESKDDMRKRGVESPDVADGLALTFAKSKKALYYKSVDPATILEGGVKPFIPGVG